MNQQPIKERRAFKLQVRATEATSGSSEQQRYIEGYAALFSQPSKLITEWVNGEWREFYETIEPGAFDQALVDPELNCIHTINHNDQLMCARTKSGTLQLTTDDIGLKYRFAVNGVSYVEDLYKQVVIGDIFESSFVFAVGQERWERKAGVWYRFISVVSVLFDTACVNNGAYSQTKVDARSLVNMPVEDPEKNLDGDLTTEFFFKVNSI
jgi:HK97 family phage prohead protease